MSIKSEKAAKEEMKKTDRELLELVESKTSAILALVGIIAGMLIGHIIL